MNDGGRENAVKSRQDEKVLEWITAGQAREGKEAGVRKQSVDSVMDPATMLNWSVLTLPRLTFNTRTCLSSLT